MRETTEHVDGVDYIDPAIHTYADVRLTGLCSSGHPLRFHGFIDSTGRWRCRVCRNEKNADRDFWRLVKRYQDGDESALKELKIRHWKTP